VLPPNRHFLLPAKINGTQRIEGIGNSMNVFYMLQYIYQKAPFRLEVTLNREKSSLTLKSEDIRQLVIVSRKLCKKKIP